MKNRGYGDCGPVFPGTKVVINKWDLNQWILQMDGVDLKNLPDNIGHISKQFHDNVRAFMPSLIGNNSEAAKKQAKD